MKNKILLTSIFCILISCIFINNCFAITITDNDKKITLPDVSTVPVYSGYSVTNDYVIVYNAGDREHYCLFLLPNNFNGKTIYSGSDKFSLSSGDFMYCNIDNGDFSKWTSDTKTSSSTNIRYIVYSTIDIYASESSDEVVFQKAPLWGATMAQVLKQSNPTQVFQNLMKNVLVSLVVFLVGFLTFSKAWAWLKTQLKKA